MFSSNVVPTPTVTWSDGFEGTVRSGLADGSYSFTFSGTNVSVVNETVTLAPSVLLSGVVTNVSCSGASDGSIDLSIAGGTAPYGFLWSNGMSTEDITNLGRLEDLILTIETLPPSSEPATITSRFLLPVEPQQRRSSSDSHRGSCNKR